MYGVCCCCRFNLRSVSGHRTLSNDIADDVELPSAERSGATVVCFNANNVSNACLSLKFEYLFRALNNAKPAVTTGLNVRT